MIALPKKVYGLSSRTGQMQTSFKNVSYSVAFLFREHAYHIQPKICEYSTVDIIDVVSTDQAVLRVEKRISINKQRLNITDMDFQEFMAFPFKSTRSGLLVYDIINEDIHDYYLDVQLLAYNHDDISNMTSGHGASSD